MICHESIFVNGLNHLHGNVPKHQCFSDDLSYLYVGKSAECLDGGDAGPDDCQCGAVSVNNLTDAGGVFASDVVLCAEKT